MSQEFNESDWARRYVLQIVSRWTGLPTASLSDSMKLSDLSVDSLDIVEFVMSFEDEFDLDVPRREVVHFDTIRDLVDWARRHGPK